VIELPSAVSADLSDADIVSLAARSFSTELGLPEKVVDVRGEAGRRRMLDLHAAALVGVLRAAEAGWASPRNVDTSP
jgi:hypothetical protein